MTQRSANYRSIWTQLYDLSFEQRWADAGGVRTRYVHAGPAGAPPLIMLHGTAGSWENFSMNLAAHAKHFDCYALDMVGSGLTDKPEQNYETPAFVKHVCDFMDALKLKRASFTGVSLGAKIATRIAVDHPQRVDKLTLVSATGLFPPGPDIAKLRAARADGAAKPTWESIKAIFKGLIHDEKNRIDDMVALRLAIYSTPEMQASMPRILATLEHDIYMRNLISEAEWRRIAAPTLLIAAVDHQDVFLDTARAVAKLIPDVRIVEIPKTAHWPQFEEPETFNRVNLEFLLGH